MSKVYKGIMLDLGCGANKQQNFVGIDKRALPEVDIVHDLEEFPYPLDDESVLTIVASHIIEHIKPWKFISLMDELWRILIPNGQLAIGMPYGVSFGYVQDPTHCNPCNEATWRYFDHRADLYRIYKPKPWEIEKGFPAWQANGNMEVLMRKVVDNAE